MLERLKETFRPIIGNASNGLTEDTVLLKDLELNSLDIIELVCAVEDEFEISIPDKMVKSIVTVKDIIELINNLK